MKTSPDYTDPIHADGACESAHQPAKKPTLADKVLPVIGNLLWPFIAAVVLTYLAFETLYRKIRGS